MKIIKPNPFNLTDYEKSIYISFHQDGILDIGIGLYLIVAGLGIITHIVFLITSPFVIIFALSGATLKKFVTMKRIGNAQFSFARRERIKKEKIFMTVFFSFTALAGLLYLIKFEVVAAWLAKISNNFPLLPLGIVFALSLMVFGYWKYLSRYYFYGFLIILPYIIGPLLNLPIYLYFFLPGFIITIIGLSIFTKFIREYPKIAIGDENEA
jgi:hypothetical protein